MKITQLWLLTFARTQTRLPRHPGRAARRTLPAEELPVRRLQADTRANNDGLHINVYTGNRL